MLRRLQGYGCSFCGKRAAVVEAVLVGPRSQICLECTERALVALGEESAEGQVTLAYAGGECTFCRLGPAVHGPIYQVGGHAICRNCAESCQEVVLAQRGGQATRMNP